MWKIRQKRDHAENFSVKSHSEYLLKSITSKIIFIYCLLAWLRRPPAAFLSNRAITRPASGTITFRQPCLSYMQSFIKIGGAVLEKNANRILTLCNFNKDSRKYTSLQIFFCPHDPKTPPKDRKPCIYIYECMPKIDHFQMLLVSKGIHRNQVFQHLKVDQTLF